MSERLTPERAVRLLRAKAAELEADVLAHSTRRHPMTGITYLTADVALIAGLLADHLERTSIPDELDGGQQ